MQFIRLLKMQLPPRQSAFLWGARKTGKSTYLKAHFPNAKYYDFLKSDTFFRYFKTPSIFREEITSLEPEYLQYPIIIDEIQKIPSLLDEIHWLIENTDAQFILCGSSARKLKNSHINLLGGRAWRYHFFPLVYQEIPNFDLLKALNQGLVPSHYLAENIKKTMNAYLQDYLKEEIQQEGLVRNLPAFARFLDALVFSCGELVNFSNIARECGIDSKTVQGYFQILVDTLLGYFIEPFNSHKGRQTIIAASKFYLFDVGVANFMMKRQIESMATIEAGHAFEQLILMELMAFRSLSEHEFDIKFWRTKSGLEVDFILGNASVALEVKTSTAVHPQGLKGLEAFGQEFPECRLITVSLDPNKRIIQHKNSTIHVYPWREFLDALWAGQIIT